MVSARCHARRRPPPIRMSSDPPAVQVVHRLPRRVHLRAPALAFHRDPGRRIADRLASEFQDHRIAVRPQTGSVIADRESGTVDADALAERLAALIAEERDESDRPLLASSNDAGRPTALARAVVAAFRGVNNDVRAALDGRADLATLTPVVLAASAVTEVARRGEFQPVQWFNLLWFSMGTFLSFSADAIVEEDNPRIDPNRSAPAR
jgi:hypothetical protein